LEAHILDEGINFYSNIYDITYTSGIAQMI
jgi:hypothetical protein